jgi:hypothetical protein
MIVYSQTAGKLNTNSSSWTPIPGLAVTIPEGVGESALVILNAPNPYATGDNYPGGNFGISVNGTMQSAYASFTYNEQKPPSTGRMPTTLCVAVPLSSSGPLTVAAMWSGVRGSVVNVDSPVTLSAVIA